MLAQSVRMRLLEMPPDVLECIESHVGDLRAWRVALARPWCPRTVAQQARWALRSRTARGAGRRRRCAHCADDCATELTWEEQYVEWVPYCVMHAPAGLLDEAMVYCNGLHLVGTAV